MSTAAVLQQHSLWGDCPLQTRPVLTPPLRLDDTSVVLHQSDWLVGADGAFGELERSVAWQHVSRPMYDRVVDVPRLVATIERADLADGHAASIIIDAVAELLGAPIERVGANLYRDGRDSVAWHRDRIGRERDWSVIVLVSLGGPRTLQIRPWQGGAGAGRRRHFRLHSGDLFVMAGACQRDWEHAVLKTARAAPRISLALRTQQFPQGPLLQHLEVTPLKGRRKLQ